MIPVHTMHLYVNWDVFIMDQIRLTMFKQISIDLISLLVNLSCELGQTNDQI